MLEWLVEIDGDLHQEFPILLEKEVEKVTLFQYKVILMLQNLNL